MEKIHRLNIRRVFNYNKLLYDSDVDVKTASNYYSIFSWKIIRDNINAGAASIFGKYGYRAQGHNLGEFNCSEFAILSIAEIIKTYYAYRGKDWAKIPWACFLCWGYFIDMPNPAEHHARIGFIVSVNGKKNYKIAFFEPRKDPNKEPVIHLATPGVIGKGDTLTFVYFP